MAISVAQSLLDDRRLRPLVDAGTTALLAELGPYGGMAEIEWQPDLADAGRLRLRVTASADCEIRVSADELAGDAGAFRQRFQREWGDAVRESFGYAPLAAEAVAAG